MIVIYFFKTLIGKSRKTDSNVFFRMVTQTDFWKTHPIFSAKFKFFANFTCFSSGKLINLFGKWPGGVFQKSVYVMPTYSKSGIGWVVQKKQSKPQPDFEENLVGTHKNCMDVFSRNQSGSCIVNFPIRVYMNKGYFSKMQKQNMSLLIRKGL